MVIEKADIAIAYRIYPAVSKVPPYFSDDKLKLSELCLYSFKQSLGDLKVKIWAILDNCPKEYEELFLKYFDSKDIEFVRENGIGNAKTFKKQMDILSEQIVSDYVYFAEDDYFYLPGAFAEMLDFIKNAPDAHFLTPYDHLDYYTVHVHKEYHQLPHSKYKNWRSVGTTCMTFLTTKQCLENTKKLLSTYCRNNWDTSMWLAITGKRLRNPFPFFKYSFSDIQYAKIWLKGWLYTPYQIIFGKKWQLYAPSPTIATHMDSLFLAPGVDWQEKFKEVDKIIFH